MLKIVRKSRAEMVGFVDTASFHPSLNRCDRHRGVRLHQQSQTIGQHLAERRVTPEGIEKFEVGSDRDRHDGKAATNDALCQKAKTRLPI